MGLGGGGSEGEIPGGGEFGREGIQVSSHAEAFLDVGLSQASHQLHTGLMRVSRYRTRIHQVL